MALLDLQAMEPPTAPSGGPPPGSRASKSCQGSNLSLALCGG